MTAIVPRELVVPPAGVYGVGKPASARAFQALCDAANHLAGYRWRPCGSMSFDCDATNVSGDAVRFIPDVPGAPFPISHTYNVPVRLSSKAAYLYVAYDYQASSDGATTESLVVRAVTMSSLIAGGAIGLVDAGYEVSRANGQLLCAQNHDHHTGTVPHHWYPVLSAHSGYTQPAAARAVHDAQPSQLVVGSQAGGLVVVQIIATDVRVLNVHILEAASEVL